jgi:hypothetical protein
MIGRETGLPCIVDFGSAKISDGDEEKVYENTDPTSKKTTKVIKDEIMVKKHQQNLIESLKK